MVWVSCDEEKPEEIAVKGKGKGASQAVTMLSPCNLSG